MQPSANFESRQQHFGTIFQIAYRKGCLNKTSSCPVPPHVLVDFVVLPPGRGSSVTDFRGWDAHEAQLRCPADVSGAVVRWSARRALKLKFY